MKLCLLSLIVLLSPVAMAQQPAADAGVIDVTLPAGATIAINGTDYGDERHFEMKPLDPKWLFPYEVVARFRGGETVERKVLLKGGWNVRLSLAPPDSSKPELVLQTTRPAGPLAFSPDGRYVLTGSLSHAAILWDVATGRQLRSFRGHTLWVHSVAFSPDGQLVLTGSGDHTAALWETSTGRRIRSFQGHTFSVYSVAFSPDGSEILTGSGDYSAVVWDTSTGQQLRSLSQNDDALSRERWAAIRAKDYARVLQLNSYPRHTNRVVSVEFRADGRQVLTGSEDKTAMLWDAQTAQRVRSFNSHTGNVNAARFSPDGSQIVTASDDKTAILWDAATGQQLRTLQGHTGKVQAVSFSPDGRRILTGSDDRTAILWDVLTGRELRACEGKSSITSVSFSPDG